MATDSTGRLLAAAASLLLGTQQASSVLAAAIRANPACVIPAGIIFYGLDWVATGPPTFALVNQVFGRRAAPVILSWIFAGHQVGGAMAAAGAGVVRSVTGDYLLAFVTSGLACLVASLLVLRVTRIPAVIASAN
jgi:hypothetical protein